MREYPSIQRQIIKSDPIIAFDKLDGSHIRSEWSRKAGFYKWGTRRRLLDPEEPILGEAVGLVLEKYSEALERVSVDERWQRCVFFFEFFGPNSFAGTHDGGDEFDVVLLDAAPHKKDILPPRDFLKKFGHLHLPNVLYEGKANQTFVESVREWGLEGITFEGVVCKGAKRPFKIKTKAWLEALKTKCGDDEDLFNRLAW